MRLGNEETRGSLLGSTLLIAGSCIGIGTLGLPVNTAQAGFQPAVVMFLISWLFMMSTGLLLLEVNLYFKEDVNLITMVDRTLGKIGQAVTWFLFLFLFYSIMVAYSSGSGELVTDFVEGAFSVVIPKWVGSIGFVTVLGVMVYFGAFAVDRLNRILMGGLILTYFMLVMAGVPHVRREFLSYVDWSQCIWAIPVMIISFGYHNLIPSLTTYLDFDAKRMRLSIILGSAIPLVGYLIWEWIILGIIPHEEFATALEQGNMITHTLKSVVGRAWIADIMEYFAFFAIVTSFLGVALSFVDFLADGLHIKKNRNGKVIVCFLALGPPLFFSILYPKIFIEALNYAGGFGAVILFGVLPALMVWVGRYRKKLWSDKILPGGKASLLLIILFGSTVFVLQLINALNLR
jgi:tyrosine-specific transport protein